MFKIFEILFLISALIIAYVYAGYPIILILIDKIKNKSNTETQNEEIELPKVSLIIAAFNEEGVIQEKIENSLQLKYPKEKLEIIIAADGSTDKTVEISQKFNQHIKLSYSPERRGKVKALMNAKDMINGDIVVISDANNMYNQDAIVDLVKHFSNPEVGGVSGAKHIFKSENEIGKNEGLYWRYEDKIKQAESNLDGCMGSCGEILAIRKELFTIPDVKEGINDDSYLLLNVYKNNKIFLYEPKAKSYEKASDTYQDEIGRRKRMSALRFNTLKVIKKPFNSFSLTWRFYSHKVLRLFLPIFMILLLISNVILLLSKNQLYLPQYIYYITLIIQVLFYIFALIDKTINKQLKIKKLTTLARFLTISNYSLLLGLLMSLTKTSTSVWKKIER